MQVLDHSTNPGAGGARIDSPRAKVCTMIFAAPQCAQTKHYLLWSMPQSGASAGLIDASRGCPSSERIGARLALRLPLAGKP